MVDKNRGWALRSAHPHFAAHFTDPLYEDQAHEFAPFGMDEGADILATWDSRRDELSPEVSLRQLFLEDQDDVWEDALAEVKGEVGYSDCVDGSASLVGYAFTLLRLTGRLDQEGHVLGLVALDHLIAFYGADCQELQIQRRDLASWVNPSS